MTPLKKDIMYSFNDIYTYSGHEKLRHIIKHRSKKALGWSDRFSSFGPEIIKNLKIAKIIKNLKLAKKNEARKI